jgi:hypothetical protein
MTAGEQGWVGPCAKPSVLLPETAVMPASQDLSRALWKARSARFGGP